MDFLELLNNRYACKAMTGETIPDEKIENILEAIRLTPTSSGLQPFEVFVITNPAIKAEIRKIAWNQSQVTDCSHLLVFAAWDTYTAERINHMFDLTNEIRGIKNEGWEAYRQKLLSFYPEQNSEENHNHAAKQTYIALMSAMTQAEYEGIDSTPMEGFDRDELDKILNLREKNLRSTLILPLGYKNAPNDWLVNLKKVRKPMSELVTLID
ncbi:MULTISPECIES: NAD(P)H-dependent oxidoreductase [Flavobacterium]|uniref:NAD(P)H nitroreductase YfkO n=1 Tax=Flavobacterium columnare TaxID=996 RepID=A0A2N9PDM2_9FLAO|nr:MULTISPECIES: NAD(P)H-dependent oxidoreductase [Flavobacterium]QYS89003.1 NAD(P)H-dependent oxidoreductase [Flavobacterium davisii]SPE78462.1 Putative NAD(P)H nitroreductase YfkO [Flavobacterium columnare]